MAGSLSVQRQVESKEQTSPPPPPARGKYPQGRSGTPASRAPPPQALPGRSLKQGTGDLPSPGAHVGSRGGGVRGRKRCPPREAGNSPKRGRRSIQHPEVLRPGTPVRRRSAQNSTKGLPDSGPTSVRLTWSGVRGGGVASLAHSPRAPSRSSLHKRRNSAAEAAILR